MTDAERLQLKLLIGPAALSTFSALPAADAFDLDEAFVTLDRNLYRLGAALLRVLCAQASEEAVAEITGKQRIKLGPIEIEEAASTGGVASVRAGRWCAEAARLEGLGGFSADDFPPMVGEWGVR